MTQEIGPLGCRRTISPGDLPCRRETRGKGQNRFRAKACHGARRTWSFPWRSVPRLGPVTAVLEGPAWAPHGLDVRAGRFPLSFEAHLLNMTAKLVPGATTVTINARYYALHGLVAQEAERRGLDLAGAYELLRRCKVVVAGTSVVHPDKVAGPPHGYDRAHPQLHRDGDLDVAALSVPQTGYAKPRSFPQPVPRQRADPAHPRRTGSGTRRPSRRGSPACRVRGALRPGRARPRPAAQLSSGS